MWGLDRLESNSKASIEALNAAKSTFIVPLE